MSRSPLTKDGVFRSIRRNLMLSAVTIAALSVGVGGLAATTNISGAVIAVGSVVAGTGLTTVQHPSGGIVKEILVNEGDPVAKGQILMRLDDTQTRASLAIVEHALAQSLAKKARLTAEIDGGAAISFPPGLTTSDLPEAAEIMAEEKRLFSVRKAALDGRKAQLTERVNQLEQQIAGLAAAQQAKAQEIVWNDKELEAVRDSWSRQMVKISRLSDMERGAARLDGDLAQLKSSIAEANGRIAEIRLQIIQLDDERLSTNAEDLRQLNGQIGELVERQRAARDQLQRVDIRAPIDGVVNEINVSSIAGVVSPGEQIMTIAPNTQVLGVEARVAPGSIDQLHIGQTSHLRFTAFDTRTTPEVEGTVSFISPDLTMDPRTRENTYVIRVDLTSDSLAPLGGLTLVPGMPVEAFIETEKRTMLSYLAKPFADQLARAFRE